MNSLSISLATCVLLVGSLAAPARAQTVDVTWTEVTPPFTRVSGSSFGNQIHWDGSHALIGSTGRIDVFRFDGTSAPVWESQLQPAVATTGYGGASAIDQGRALVVANTDSMGQFVYEFAASGTTWTEVTHLANPAPHWGDGTLVAVTMDGPRWAVSAPYISGNAGEVDVVRSPTTAPITWTTSNRSVVFGPGIFTGHVLAMRGADLLVSVIEANVGGVNAGSVTLYHDTGTSLTTVVTIDNPTPGNIDQFGDGSALDDTYLYIGAHYDDTMGTDAGAVYVYDRAGALQQTIYGTVPNGRFGASISVDGDWMAISAPTTFAVPGLAHLFLYQRDASGMWQQRASLADMEGASATYFGLDTRLRSHVLLTAAFQATGGGATNGGRVWYGVMTTRDGGTCSASSDCTHGHCVSGICCNTACSGACDACGTGTCAVMACPDAGTDGGTDAAMSLPDAGIDGGVDAATLAPDTGVDAGPVPDVGARSDTGARADGSALADASAADAGGVPRVPLSCTCRASASGSTRLPLSFLLAIVLVGCHRRRGAHGRNALRRR